MKIAATVGEDDEYVYREIEISATTKEQEVTIITEDCTWMSISVTGEGASALMYNARLCRE